MKTLSQAGLERRQRELDAREKFLDDRESILSSGPIDIKVLEGKVAVRKKQLLQIDKKIQATEEVYKKEVTTKKRELEKLQELILAGENRTERLAVEVAQLSTEVINQRNKLNKIKQEIKDNSNYRLEQEKLIADSMEEGNLTLKSTQYQINDLVDVKEKLTYEVAVLEQNKLGIQDELTRSQREAAASEREINERKKILEDQLAKIDAEIREAAKRKKTVEDEIEAKFKVLDTKEKEILAKNNALQREYAEIETEKRRWNSQKSLYDL